MEDHWHKNLKLLKTLEEERRAEKNLDKHQNDDVEDPREDKLNV